MNQFKTYVWITISLCNHYLKKKKNIRNIYLYLSIFQHFSISFNLVYTFSILPYKIIPNNPIERFNQLIRTTNKSWRTDAIVQQLPLLDLQRIGAHDSTSKVSNESFNEKQNRIERKERSKRRAQQLNPLGKLVSM